MPGLLPDQTRPDTLGAFPVVILGDLSDFHDQKRTQGRAGTLVAMTRTVALGALRGAAAGASTVAAVVLIWFAAERHLQSSFDARDPEGLVEVIVVLTLLPTVVLVVGLVVAGVLRLRGWWAVAIVAPVLTLTALEPLPSWPVFRAAVAVLVYAAAGAVSTAIARPR